jgi:hypothetical protein
MLRKVTVLFLCLFSGIYSCTKDSSPDYPSVQITQPYSLATFNVPGTIQVTGHASDSKTLTSLTVYIANGQNEPVEQKVPVNITSNNMNFTCSYSLDDIHMASGQYYMTVSASNGTNTGSAFQQIYIDAVPTKRTAIYAITRSSAGINAWKIDSVFHATLNYTVSGDYASSDINSYYQQLYITGHDSGYVNVYSVPYGTFDWNILSSFSPAPYFTNAYCNNDAEFISYYNPGLIKCFNHGGTIQSTFSVLAGDYPIKTFLWNGFLFAEEKSISSNQESIGTFYQASTVTYQQQTLPGPVVAMYGYNNTHIFIFGNNNSGGAYVELYNIPSNLFYAPISLPSGKLLSTAQVNANTYLLSFSNGTSSAIYQYAYNSNSIGSYINGITASTIRYDSINNEVIASSGNIVNAYNYNSAAKVSSVMLSDSVRDIRILFNK